MTRVLPIRPSWAVRVLEVAASILLALAVVALLTHGVRIDAGPIHISATRSSRLFMEAFVVLIARQLLASNLPAAPRERLTLLFLLGALLLSLAAGSFPRRVGDGGEYMAMALNLAKLRPPALLPQDIVEAEQSLARIGGYGSFSLTKPDLRGSDGRQDFPHFWFYPLLAVPLVALAEAVGAHPNNGFTALNLLLLLVTAAIMLRRVSLAMAVLLLGGPILWWVDKAHTEVLTFSLLSIAILLLEDAPWWALLALGVAATQNPPISVTFLFTLVCALWSRGWTDSRVVAAGALGILLCGFHPAYFQWHLRLWSPLEEATLSHWPSFTAWITPVLDPNLGILVHFPVLTILLLVGVANLLRRPREHVARWELWIGALSGLVFLFSFTQTANVNHGGTPDPSRYGLWLVPLASYSAAEAGGAAHGARVAGRFGSLLPGMVLLCLQSETVGTLWRSHPTGGVAVDTMARAEQSAA